MEAVWYILEELCKHGLFANLKNCCFHQEEVHFLGYIVSSQKIYMEKKKIDAIKAWPETKSVQDIQMFIEFANFYRRFIQGFSKIAAPLTLMLKTSFQLDGTLPATSVDDSKVVGSSDGNEGKSAKSDFTKPVCRAEKPSFLTPGAR